MIAIMGFRNEKIYPRMQCSYSSDLENALLASNQRFGSSSVSAECTDEEVTWLERLEDWYIASLD